MKELYKFFAYNGKVVDITEFEKEHLKIFSREVLKMINDGNPGWENLLPHGIAEIIKQHQLFGYDSSKVLAKSN
jgi:hypothetical protein